MNGRIGIKAIVGCIFVATLAASSAARAEMMYLQCGQVPLIAVDLTNHTLDGKPAEITPISIDWQGPTAINGGDAGDSNIQARHIDRTTGMLTTTNTVTAASNGRTLHLQPSTYSCVAVSAPATKF